MAAVKALFSGAVDGGLPALLKKVDAVNKKNGPFDVLFAVGSFFGPGAPDAEPDAAMINFATGAAAVPVPVHFIGGYAAGAGSAAILAALPAGKSKLHYLGTAGVVNFQGLNIAFLDGTFDAAAYSADAGHVSVSSPSPHYSKADVDALKQQLKVMDGDVDVLLTCEWPAGLTRGLPDSQLPAGYQASTSGSAVVAEIAALARPRYHFAGGEAVHIARPPYVNRDLGAGPRATRFIGLAPANNTAKQKALHALSLVPSAGMDLDALAVIPEGAGPSPYEDASKAVVGSKRPQDQEQVLPEGQDWRWQSNNKKPRRDPPKPILANPAVPRDPSLTIIARNIPFHATEGDIRAFFARVGTVTNISRGLNAEGKVHASTYVQFDSKDAVDAALQLHNQELSGRQVLIEPHNAPSAARDGAGRPEVSGKPVEGCWFCLGSSSVDVGLVASVCEESYLAIDKGPISDEHVLVVPVDHYPSSLTLSPQCYNEVDRYLSALRSYFATLGKELVAFERHLALRKSGGNHCHINVIAIPPSAATRARQAFEDAASKADFELLHLPASTQSPEDLRRSLRAVLGQNEYFMALLPDGSRLIRSIARNERWPMNLGREVLADLAGQPSRADWKACAQTANEEAARTERFKAAFKPYDIMAAE